MENAQRKIIVFADFNYLVFFFCKLKTFSNQFADKICFSKKLLVYEKYCLEKYCSLKKAIIFLCAQNRKRIKRITINFTLYINNGHYNLKIKNCTSLEIYLIKM